MMTDKAVTIKSTNALASPVPMESREEAPQSMIALALQNGADPATLGRLMDLQERYEANQAKKAYVAAMAEFKKEAPAVLAKDALVDFTSSKGRTRYKHATLGGVVLAITSALSRHGLSVSWETAQTAGAVRVTCHVTHSQGHRESTALQGPNDDSGNKNAIQMIGSAVTYLQRYTLLAALGLATADQDDADAAPDRKAPAMPTKREPAAAPAGASQVMGLVEDVAIATSKPGDKRQWTKYGVTVGGAVYGTFDAVAGKTAQDAKEEGVPVVVEYVTNAKGYHDLTGIRIDAEEPQAPGANEELPFA